MNGELGFEQPNRRHPFEVTARVISEEVEKIQDTKALSAYIGRLGTKYIDLDFGLRTQLMSIFINRINELTSDQAEAQTLVNQLSDQLANRPETSPGREKINEIYDLETYEQVALFVAKLSLNSEQFTTEEVDELLEFLQWKINDIGVDPDDLIAQAKTALKKT